MRDWLLSPGFLLAGSVVGAIAALALAAHTGGAF